jgi:hypothetical protein
MGKLSAMNFGRPILFFFLLTGLLFEVKLVLADTHVDGFVKLSYLNYNSHFDSQNNYELNQIGRFSINTSLFKNVRLESSYELLHIYQKINFSDKLVDYSQSRRAYRVDDFVYPIVKSHSSYFLHHNLDRLLVSYEGDQTHLTLGRQQIALGVGRTVNPTDIFTPFSFLVVDTEVRNGVDALRLRYQFSEMGQFDTGVVLGENLQDDNSGAYFQVHTAFLESELSPIVAYFLNAGLYGADFATSFLGNSFWLEAAKVVPKDFSSYFRMALGFERQLTSDLIFFTEYYFNEAGKRETSEYAQTGNDFAYQKGGVFLLGQQYVTFGAHYQVSPLTLMTFSLKMNLTDSSFFLSSSGEWNLLENFYISMGGYVGLGKSSQFQTSLNSEFGATGSALFIRLKSYF